jgi:hypothetical protein
MLDPKFYSELEAKKIDFTFSNKPLSEIIKEIDDAADAKTKVQKANEDLIAARNGLDKENKELKAAITKAQKDFEDFKQSHSGDNLSPALTAKFNTMQTTIDDLSKTLKTEQEARTKSEKERILAEVHAREKDLENRLQRALGDVGIKSAKSIRAAIALIREEKLINVAVNDKGEITELITINKGGKPNAATEKELAEYIAAEYENLVDSSGNGGGTGVPPNQSPKRKDNRSVNDLKPSELRKKRDDALGRIAESYQKQVTK